MGLSMGSVTFGHFYGPMTILPNLSFVFWSLLFGNSGCLGVFVSLVFLLRFVIKVEVNSNWLRPGHERGQWHNDFSIVAYMIDSFGKVIWPNQKGFSIQFCFCLCHWRKRRFHIKSCEWFPKWSVKIELSFCLKNIQYANGKWFPKWRFASDD